MRRRFVLRPVGDGYRLVELDLDSPPVPARGPYVRSDIAPYRSMRTGEVIAGRAAHRAHLARYDLIEIGNERRAFEASRLPAGPAKGEIAGDIKRELARDPAERRAQAETALRGAGYQGPQIERLLKS